MNTTVKNLIARTHDSSLLVILVDLARDPSTDKGETWSRIRNLLLARAKRELHADLRPKLDASDIVQQSLLEAHTAIDQFGGTTEAELIAQLIRIVDHNVADAGRHYRQTQCRDISREQPHYAEQAAELLARDPTPSHIISRRETDRALENAILELPPGRQQILHLRYRDGLKFTLIAQAMNLTEQAARQLHQRTLGSLRKILSDTDAQRSAPNGCPQKPR